MQVILNAALTCFNRQGFQSTSMDDIAREAGVSKGLLHYHFRSKEQLLLEVQALLFRRISDRVEGATAQLGPSVQQALWAFDELWKLLKRAQPLLPVFLDMAARSLTRKTMKKRLAESIEEQRTLLVDGIRTVLGPLQSRLDMSAEGFADVVMAVLIGLCGHSLFAGDPARADRAFEDFKKMLVSMLRGGPRSVVAESDATERVPPGKGPEQGEVKS